MATRSLLATYVGSAGALTHTQSVTLAAGVKRTIVVMTGNDMTNNFASGTFNSAALTNVAGATIANVTDAAIDSGTWYYDVPDALAEDDYDVVMTLSGTGADLTFYVYQLTGVATGGPEDADETQWTTTSTNATLTLTCTDGAVMLAQATTGAASQTWAITGDVTEAQEQNETNYTTVVADAVISGAGEKSVTATVSSGGTGNKTLVAVSWAAITGPTITTQPAAATAVVSPPHPATMTVVTAAAMTAVQWQDDGTNISGADVSLVTSLASGTSALTLTPTATTRTGSAITAECTDATGMTESNAATLTVRAGVTEVATTSTTDGSGQVTGTLKTDVRGDASEKMVAFVALMVNGEELSGAGTGAWLVGLAP